MPRTHPVIPSVQSENYNSFVEEIVSMIQSHQIVAVKSVDSITNQLYWNMGEHILAKQAEYGWGQAVIDNLSRDLTARFGDDTISYSKRNLQLMRQLVLEYSNVKQLASHLDTTNVNQAGSLLDITSDNQSVINVKQPVSHLELPIVTQAGSHLDIPTDNQGITNVNQADSYLLRFDYQ